MTAKKERNMQKHLAFKIGILLLVMGLTTVFFRYSSSSAAAVNPIPEVGITEATRGFGAPLDIDFTGVPGDDRFFVTEFGGSIRIGGVSYNNPFLDISEKVDAQGEKGMLGMVFDPNFAVNQYFYVFYTTAPNESGVFSTFVERYTVSDDPNVADPNSATPILQFNQQSEYHNGGNLAFGPDGYLYIGVGDDTFYVDSADLNSLNGKILRIDVNTDSVGNRPADCDTVSGNYSIPADNPFVGEDACEEIWAYGLRNPWRFSFDAETGDMYLGDVGDERTEELNFQPASSTGGENYGWPYFEGVECHDSNYPKSACDSITNHTPPIFEYPHSAGGGSITGGFVYRGTTYPRLYGHYIFGDFTSSQIWTAMNNNGTWEVTDQGYFADPLMLLSSFGSDPQGNVYASSLSNPNVGTGVVYQIIDEFGFEIEISAVDQVTLSDQIEYTLTIKNVGAGTATNMVVENVIPENVTWVSGGVVSDGKVIWPITELASDATTTVSWMAQPTVGGVDIINDDYQISVDEWIVEGDLEAVTSVVDGIFGKVFLDENQNDLIDGTEPGIPDVTIFMWEDSTCDGQTTSLEPVDSTVSGANGAYVFPISNNEICYILQLNLDTVPSNLQFSAVDVGSDDSIDIDFYDNGWTAQIQLPTQAVHAGLYDPTQPTPTATPVPPTETPTPEATETPLPTETPTPMGTAQPPAELDIFSYLPFIAE